MNAKLYQLGVSVLALGIGLVACQLTTGCGSTDRHARYTGSGGEFYDSVRGQYFFYDEDGNRIYNEGGASRTGSSGVITRSTSGPAWHYDPERREYFVYDLEGNRVYAPPVD